MTTPTIGSSRQALAADPTSPPVLRPNFISDTPGWTLAALDVDDGVAVTLQAQGLRLIDRSAGLPWQPSASAPTNRWSGSLAAGSPARFSFSTRDSELASTVKTPGAAGTVVYAVETTVGSTLAAEGATVLGKPAPMAKRFSCCASPKPGWRC